jgi:protein-S-isoprenylcysteine O-methyltransferase Ste14
VFTSGSVPTAAGRTFAWAGGALFAASLLYFLFTYFVTFGETAATIAPQPPEAARTFVAGKFSPIAWNVALFTIFALHHSLFARERVRAGMQRLTGSLERAVYVWIASALFIVVCAAWRPVPGTVWKLDGAAAWSLGVVQILGVWLTLRGASVLDVFDLAGIRQLQKTPSAAASIEFKTTGPYGWIRHPIYAGWFIVVLAVPTMTMTRLVFAMTSCAYLLLAIPLEERSLRRTTGGAYEIYMRRVPWKLVPGILSTILVLVHVLR